MHINHTEISATEMTVLRLNSAGILTSTHLHDFIFYQSSPLLSRLH